MQQQTTLRARNKGAALSITAACVGGNPLPAENTSVEGSRPLQRLDLFEHNAEDISTPGGSLTHPIAYLRDCVDLPNRSHDAYRYQSPIREILKE